jgi:hypothetical protein
VESLSELRYQKKSPSKSKPAIKINKGSPKQLKMKSITGLFCEELAAGALVSANKFMND